MSQAQSPAQNLSETEPQSQNTTNADLKVRSKRPTSLKLYKLNAQHVTRSLSVSQKSSHKASASTPQSCEELLAQFDARWEARRKERERTCKCMCTCAGASSSLESVSAQTQPQPHRPDPSPTSQGHHPGNPIVAHGDDGEGVRFADEKDMLGATGRREVGVVVDNAWKGGRMVRSSRSLHGSFENGELE